MVDRLSKIKESIVHRGLINTFLLILQRLRKNLNYLDPALWTSYITYRLDSDAIRYNKDLPVNRDKICDDLKRNNIKVEAYRINLSDFHQYLALEMYSEYQKKLYGANFIEKALEHYLSLKIGQLDRGSTIFDVANAGSPFPIIAKALYECNVYSNDLKYPKGVRKIRERIYEVGGNAVCLPVPDNIAERIVLHCAFEMFEGDDDIGLIKEASRILKPGGTLIIIPLYLHESYIIYRDPLANPRGCQYDPKAQIIWRPNFYKVRHARFYNPDAFNERCIKIARENMLSPKVLFIENNKEVDVNCYMNFVGVFEKQNILTFK